MNSVAVNFFVELFQRLKTKSPTFFRVLMAFAAILTFAGYLPTMLQNWFNVDMPDNLVTMCKDIAKYSTGFLVATALPTQSQQVSVTAEGEILQKTDSKALPFTAVKEIKQAEQKGGVLAPQTDVVPEVVATKEEEVKKDEGK